MEEILSSIKRIIAEDRYSMAMDMLRENVGDFYAGIVKLNAATDARKNVIDKTIGYADRLQATEGPNDDILAVQALSHILNLFCQTT